MCILNYLDVFFSLKEHDEKEDTTSKDERMTIPKNVINILQSNQGNLTKNIDKNHKIQHTAEEVLCTIDYISAEHPEQPENLQKPVLKWRKDQIHELFVTLAETPYLAKIYSNLSEPAREFLLPETRDLIESTAPKS